MRETHTVERRLEQEEEEEDENQIIQNHFSLMLIACFV